jgi:hypothetical protein
MISLTIAEEYHPDRFDVWLGNENDSDAERLGRIQPGGSGQIDDLSPTWHIEHQDGTWSEIECSTAAVAVEFLRIAHSAAADRR